MVDIISPERRSWNMSRIRSADTSPERAVRSVLHRLGCRFRVNYAGLPGRPDIVIPKIRTVILVHGCFWHRHKGCRYAYEPKSRRNFWMRKFSENVSRDVEVRRTLRGMGWRVITVWECQTFDRSRLEKQLVRKLRLNRPPESTI